MKLELDLNPKKIGFLVLCCFIVGAAGYYFGQNQQKTQIIGQCDYPTNLELSQKDLNYIRDVSFYLNGCEKLGLISDLMIQQDQNGKIYGIPICTTGDIK